MSRATRPTVHRRFIAPALLLLGLVAACDASFAADSKVAGDPVSAAHVSTAKKTARAGPVVLVDINSASRTQLKTLPGIGDAEAGRIIAGRPYLSKADLASKKVIPAGVYLSLKDRVVAVQKQPPKGRS